MQYLWWWNCRQRLTLSDVSTDEAQALIKYILNALMPEHPINDMVGICIISFTQMGTSIYRPIGLIRETRVRSKVSHAQLQVLTDAPRMFST